jgi:adenylate cyclase
MTFPSIPLSLAKDILSKKITVDPKGFLHLGEIKVPIDEYGRMLINYRGGANTFPYIPFYKVLEGAVPEEFFRNKIVFVGATDPGLYDLRLTPMGYIPGVEVLANTLDNILVGPFLIRTNISFNIFVVFFVCLVGSLFFLRSRNIVLSSATFLTFLVLIIILSIFLFEARNLWVDVFRPVLGLSVSFVSVVGYKFVTEQKERRKIKETFSQYVSKDVVDKILDDPESLKLGGEKRIVTVLFCDIKGFTSFLEDKDPAEAVVVLNNFFKVMSDIIFSAQGMIDKYIGDEIMAVFGAPLSLKNHAKNAVLAAIKMCEATDTLNKRWRYKGFEGFDIGIGINTGEVIVGNIGYSRFRNYTVIGDSVNIASRLQTLTKRMNTRILISQATYDFVKDIVKTRCLKEIALKGKRLPIGVYEVLGLDTARQVR